MKKGVNMEHIKIGTTCEHVHGDVIKPGKWVINQSSENINITITGVI